MTIKHISAVTLAVRDMPRSVGFYQAVGFETLYGGPESSFTSLAVGAGYLNLTLAPEGGGSWWGRVIFYVDDVDGFYRKLLDAGLSPGFAPKDAPWGERYFHIIDPDGHELSFAMPLRNV